MNLSDAFVGCFNENFTDREFSIYSGLPGYAAMGHWACIGRCSGMGYKYAAINSGLFCFCGNSVGKYGASPTETCVHPKVDKNPSDRTVFANSVFHYPSNTSSVSVIIPKNVTWGKVTNISVIFPAEGRNRRLQLTVNFGDGRVESTCSKHHVTHVYRSLGRYSVKVLTIFTMTFA